MGFAASVKDAQVRSLLAKKVQSVDTQMIQKFSRHDTHWVDNYTIRNSCALDVKAEQARGLEVGRDEIAMSEVRTRGMGDGR